MRSRWIAVMVAVSSSAYADPSYIEKFVGWSKDNSFYLMTQAGTDEMDLPALCLGKRGTKPASWPKDFPAPDPDDDRGCNSTEEVFAMTDASAVLDRLRKIVVAPGGKAPHGETTKVHKIGDGSMVEVTIAQGKKVLGKGYITLRDKSFPAPETVSTYWRADGLAAAVEAGYPPSTGENPGFGPPTFLVVIPLDGSTANMERPKTPREQSRALNLEGMKLLKAGKLDEAQKQFVAASEADPSFSIALYNLASVASLRKDTGPAATAILKVVDLASSDKEAKQAIAKAKTDHDLDFIAGESPYIAKLLGRPRTKGDDWCIAAEKRAREMNPGNFVSFANQAGPVIEAGARGGIISEAVFTCHVSASGGSQFSITQFIRLTDKNKHDRNVRTAWEIFPDGLYDADAIVDEKAAKTVRLKQLERVAWISKAIAGVK